MGRQGRVRRRAGDGKQGWETVKYRDKRVRRAAVAALAAVAIAASAGGCDDGGSGGTSAGPSRPPGPDGTGTPGGGATAERARQSLDHFLATYQQALYGEGQFTREALRDQNVTPEYRPRLVEWEKENHADGILRAEDVPRSWTIRASGGAGTRASVVLEVTFVWEDAPTSVVRYAYDARTLKIRDIREK